MDVGRILNFRGVPANPMEGVALLVESEGGGQRALMVDAIQGQRQVVIKSLEANYTMCRASPPPTILGDGRVGPHPRCRRRGCGVARTIAEIGQHAGCRRITGARTRDKDEQQDLTMSYSAKNITNGAGN